MNRVKKIIFGILALTPSYALAAKENTILGKWSLDQFTDTAGFFKPTNEGFTAGALIGNIMNIATNIAGMAAVAMIIWGGATMMLSSGNPEKVQTAKKILTAAVVGLIIILMSKIIVYWIATAIPGS